MQRLKSSSEKPMRDVTKARSDGTLYLALAVSTPGRCGGGRCRRVVRAHARLSGRPVWSGPACGSRQPDALLGTRQGAGRKGELRARRPFCRRCDGRLRPAEGFFAPPPSRAVVAATSWPSPPSAKPTRGHRLHLEQPDQERNRVARERERKPVRGCAFPPLSRSRRG